MGVNLTPISIRRTLDLEELAGRTLAVDAYGELYQFLALIRLPDGSPLHDAAGNVTSHLAGLLYRTTRLMGEHGMKLVFVFDGKPPQAKSGELARRRAIKERYTREYREALAGGDLARAFSKSTMTSRLTGPMVQDAWKVLGLLGIPCVQAPGEGEAQAASMAARGEVWAAASKDYDSLLFGAPRLVRFLAISGKEFLPRTGTSRPVPTELIDREQMLSRHGIGPSQLIDIGILVGTDFNEGVKGIGPRKALKLVQTHGAIENMPEEVRARAGDYQAVRDLYLQPEVTADYALHWGPLREEEIMDFLCRDRGFSPERVRRALERMKGSKA